MAAIGRGMLSSVDNVLMPRLRGAPSKGIRIGGYTLPPSGVEADYVELERQQAGDHNKETRIESLDWLDGTSFALALTDADSETNAGEMPGLTLWGQGDIQSFRADRSSVDGEVRTVYVGVDAEQPGGWLLGAVLSHSSGKIDYTYDSGNGSRSGRLRTKLTGVYPYLQWRTGENSSIWAILGLGSGRIENRRTGPDSVEHGDLTMLMISGGGRYELDSIKDGVNLALLGDAAMLRLKSKSDLSDDTLDNASSSVERIRFGLETSHDILTENGTLSPYGQLSARFDSGDGETGSGAELAGGIRHRGDRLLMELGGRTIRIGGRNYRQHGWNIGCELAPRQGGEGLSLSLSSSWGESGHRPVEALWSPDALSSLDTASDVDNGPEIKTKIGYGFRWPSAPALLTPYAQHDHLANGERHFRLGVGIRLEFPSTRFDLDLRGELDQSPDGKDEQTGIFLDAVVRF